MKRQLFLVMGLWCCWVGPLAAGMTIPLGKAKKAEKLPTEEQASVIDKVIASTQESIIRQQRARDLIIAFDAALQDFAANGDIDNAARLQSTARTAINAIQMANLTPLLDAKYLSTLVDIATISGS